MDLFDRIKFSSAVFDNNPEINKLFKSGQLKFASDIARPAPRQDVIEIDAINAFMKRNPMAGGGMLVKPSADGSRPGYAKDYATEEGLTQIQKQKIIKAFPNTKFDFDKFKYGVKKYLTGDQNKTNKDYTKVIRFIKKGFTTEMGEGKNTRGEKYSKEGKRLSIKDQNKIKATFELPPGEEWDFKTHKYGIKQEGRENLLKRMAQKVANKNPWTLAADFGSAKGWMLAQMERVYKNESKNPNIKKLTYKPVYEKINGIDRIIGFKDNTVAGQGKTYYGLNKYTKKNAGDWTKHGDYKLNLKLIDISKRSFNQPNEVIQGLLKEKGFTGKVNLNQLINFLAETDQGSAENLKNAVVRHHNSGVAFGSATNDLSLTTQTINKKIVEAEKRIRANNILPEDVQLLKNNNVYVRSGDGKLYGAGSKTPIGQYKQIESDVASKIANIKIGSPLHKKLMKFCPKNSGATAGVCSVDEAVKGMISEADQLKSGKMNIAQANQTAKKLRAVKAVGTGSTLMATLGPYGIGGEVALEGMFIANDMLDKGKTYKEALSTSLLRYAMPTDKRKELEKSQERNKLILGNDTTGLAASYVDSLNKIKNMGDAYNKYQMMEKDESFDPFTLESTYSPKDRIKAEKDFYRAMRLTMPKYGVDAFENIKYDSPAMRAFETKEEVFDANKMKNKMAYDDKILGPIKDLFGTGYYTDEELERLQKEADQESLAIGQIPDEDKMQMISEFGGVSKLASGGIASLSGGDKSGPAPESGPQPQGLPYVYNRVKRT